MTLARLERRKKAKADRKAILAAEREEPVILKTIDPDAIVFEADGYKHKTCPVADISNIEIMGIMQDTLYCIDVGLPPNEGTAFDQSYLYRVAFTTLSREREAVKAEREQKQLEKAKNKNKTPSKGGKK